MADKLEGRRRRGRQLLATLRSHASAQARPGATAQVESFDQAIKEANALAGEVGGELGDQLRSAALRLRPRKLKRGKRG